MSDSKTTLNGRLIDDEDLAELDGETVFGAVNAYGTYNSIDFFTSCEAAKEYAIENHDHEGNPEVWEYVVNADEFEDDTPRVELTFNGNFWEYAGGKWYLNDAVVLN